jgi:hypothetical protein
MAKLGATTWLKKHGHAPHRQCLARKSSLPTIIGAQNASAARRRRMASTCPHDTKRGSSIVMRAQGSKGRTHAVCDVSMTMQCAIHLYRAARLDSGCPHDCTDQTDCLDHLGRATGDILIYLEDGEDAFS